MKITGHEVEKLVDPTGIIIGDRYEFYLDIEVSEDDELYTDKGLSLKVIYAVDEQQSKIALYQIYEKLSNQPLDFELEDDEKQLVNDYCKEVIEAM
ncbi:DUF6509 family protein [Heyndrickxia ginsengihumi]|uniref:Pullulanase n=1 Tax=Heyndrickxia ginsengihumi TaxID=363870 RepID=A0A0A6VHL8_9BACI|nr:DUF6509 family protein [Heyndrickxia ginsengihumi]KHD86124.1 pullulanase [Heyndrickxia ginsengihumi]MBE6184943.1 pullulanase [Bacillus sp. (in: firmicutes)]MCM3023378.1 DUF6509 family protein [Heyndrickxia ginsengihumi]NEY21315.1 pullulanase [Heyndrickxia ginsengihumi]